MIIQSVQSPVVVVQSLRGALFGGTFHVFSVDWRRARFSFRDRAYALQTDSVVTVYYITGHTHRLLRH